MKMTPKEYIDYPDDKPIANYYATGSVLRANFKPQIFKFDDNGNIIEPKKRRIKLKKRKRKHSLKPLTFA